MQEVAFTKTDDAPVFINPAFVVTYSPSASAGSTIVVNEAGAIEVKESIQEVQKKFFDARNRQKADENRLSRVSAGKR